MRFEERTHMLTLGFIQNFGLTELIVILVIVLLLFGHRLPGVGRALGRSVSEFKAGVKDGQQEEQKAQAPAQPPAPAAPAEKK